MLLYQLIKNGGTLPYYVKLDLTWKCNADCIMCSQKDKIKNNPSLLNELPTERIVALIEEMADLGTRSIVFSGGEPTLRKDLAELIRFCNNKGIKTQVNTNGFLISESMADRLVSSGLNKINFSLDSSSPKGHNKIRQKNLSFQNCIEGIKNIRKSARKCKKDVKIEINYVLMKDNYIDIQGILDQDLELNVLKIIPVSPNNKNLMLEFKNIKEFYSEIIPKLIKKSKENKVQILYPSYKFMLESYLRQKTKKKISCPFPWWHTNILPNGSLTPCCKMFAYNPENIVGNVGKKSLKSEFMGEGYREFRDKFKESSFKEICKDCIDYEFYQSSPVKKLFFRFAEKIL